MHKPLTSLLKKKKKMRRHSDVGMSSTSGTRTKRTITRKLSVEHDECPTKVVAIGICAMEKKV